MIRVGITGQSGFIGTHLYNTLGLYPGEFSRVPFRNGWFGEPEALAGFVGRCDVIVHLSAVNRHPDGQALYDANVELVEKLIRAMESARVRPHVLFSSSVQQELDNPYGQSKLRGSELFIRWAECAEASYTGLVIPNVFGPFGRPDHNSFVATFCHRLTHGEAPEIQTDKAVDLLYVGSLCREIVEEIRRRSGTRASVEEFRVSPDFRSAVSQVLGWLMEFRDVYLDRGEFPFLPSDDQRNLFNTFRSYIDPDTHFPVLLKRNEDPRGVFVETVRSGGSGQVSFSTTRPGITRGEHYHTRKIERFTVLKGRARICLRRIGTDRIYEFLLDGESPAYVDMPVWYTHNITNVGTDDLYTQFWIDQPYDPSDPDTFYEPVRKDD